MRKWHSKQSKFNSVISILVLFIFGTLIFTGCSSDVTEEQYEAEQANDPGDEALPVDSDYRDVGEGAIVHAKQAVEDIRPEEMQVNQPSYEERPFDMGDMGIEECDEKAQGDSCLIKTLRGEVQGTCIDVDGVLRCTPEREGMPSRPGR